MKRILLLAIAASLAIQGTALATWSVIAVDKSTGRKDFERVVATGCEPTDKFHVERS